MSLCWVYVPGHSVKPFKEKQFMCNPEDRACCTVSCCECVKMCRHVVRQELYGGYSDFNSPVRCSQRRCKLYSSLGCYDFFSWCYKIIIVSHALMYLVINRQHSVYYRCDATIYSYPNHLCKRLLYPTLVYKGYFWFNLLLGRRHCLR